MIESIIRSYFAGLIWQSEAVRALELLQVRGGFDRSGFTGYDYRNQRWIDIKV